MSRQCSVPHHHQQPSFVIRIPLKILLKFSFIQTQKSNSKRKFPKRDLFVEKRKFHEEKEKKVFRLQKEIRKIRRHQREKFFQISFLNHHLQTHIINILIGFSTQNGYLKIFHSHWLI